MAHGETILEPTTDKSPRGYRLMRKQAGNPLWERLNVIVPGHRPEPGAVIPYEVLSALLDDAPLDVSPSVDRTWPFDLVLSDEWSYGFDQNTLVFRREGIVPVFGPILLTRRGGTAGDHFSVSNPDDLDLKLEGLPRFTIGLLADSAVDPVVRDLHLEDVA